MHTPLMARLRKFLGLHVFRVLVMPLDGLPALKVRHPELRYEPLSEQTAQTWCDDREMELDAGAVRAAYLRGDVCVGVSSSLGPVGYVWFAFDRAPHGGCWVEFHNRIRYAYKAFIRPSWRGRRISQELYTRASEICPRRDRTLGLIIIYSDNAVSLRASLAAGRSVAGYAGYLQWFRLILPFRSPGVRQHGFRFASKVSPSRLSPVTS